VFHFWVPKKGSVISETENFGGKKHNSDSGWKFRSMIKGTRKWKVQLRLGIEEEGTKLCSGGTHHHLPHDWHNTWMGPLLGSAVSCGVGGVVGHELRKQ